MTIQEMGAVMDILTIAYPTYYRNTSDDDRFKACQLWAAMFADDDPRAVTEAVKAFISTDTKGFPPVIGAIKDRLVKLHNPEQLSEGEAWALVRKAVGNSAYNSRKEFDALPSTIRKIVGSPGQLKEWGLIELDTFQTVVQSNFMRSYRTMGQREYELQKLPASVREFMALTAGNMPQLEGDTENAEV